MRVESGIGQLIIDEQPLFTPHIQQHRQGAVLCRRSTANAPTSCLVLVDTPLDSADACTVTRGQRYLVLLRGGGSSAAAASASATAPLVASPDAADKDKPKDKPAEGEEKKSATAADPDANTTESRNTTTTDAASSSPAARIEAAPTEPPPPAPAPLVAATSLPPSCADGLHSAAFKSLPQSFRPTLLLGSCAPYPAFPPATADASVPGSLASLLLSTGVRGGAAASAAVCTTDPCALQGVVCPVGSGVACVTKAAAGKVVAHNVVFPFGACSAAFVDLVTGGWVLWLDFTGVQKGQVA